jgi:hypothetical protein
MKAVRCVLASLRVLDDVGGGVLELLGTFKFKVAGSSFAPPQKVLRLVPNHGAALLYAYHKRQATSRGWPPSPAKNGKS